LKPEWWLWWWWWWCTIGSIEVPGERKPVIRDDYDDDDDDKIIMYPLITITVLFAQRCFIFKFF
jgi:hypothetical protein